jgi:hypothetical protein
LEKPIMPAFEAHVVRLPGIAGDADHGGDVDDAAEAAAHHRVRQFPGQPEDSRQVDLQHRVPVGIRHAHEQAVLGDAGIVDENIDAFELRFGLLAERLDLVAIRKIGRENLHAVAEFAASASSFSTRVPCRPRSRPAHAAAGRWPRRCRRTRR